MDNMATLLTPETTITVEPPDSGLGSSETLDAGSSIVGQQPSTFEFIPVKEEPTNWGNSSEEGDAVDPNPLLGHITTKWTGNEHLSQQHDAKEVEAKIKKLRSQYLLGLKKMRLSKKSGGDDVYASKHKMLKNLQFLKKGYSVPTSTLKLNGLADEGMPDSVKEMRLDFVERDGNCDNNPQRNKWTTSGGRGAPHLSKVEEMKDTLLQVSLQCLPSDCWNERSDDCDWFCRHLATQLRKLDEHPRLIAKKRIGDLMFDILMPPSTSLQTDSTSN